MATSQSSAPRSGTSGDAWEKAARAGYALSGVLHIILGFLVVRIGLGSSEEADSSSALSDLSGAPLGVVILWVAVVAFLALAAWQAADAIHQGNEAKERGKSAGKAGIYLALAFTSASIALGSGESNGDSQAQGFAGTLMEAPAGRLLVGALGLGILAAGIFHIYKGVTKKFVDDLKVSESQLSTVARGLGVAGYAAKGFALAVIGVLFTYAAVTADPDKAQGIDGAIESLLSAPGGPVLVVLVGIGFAAYGLYLFVRARHARM